MAGEIDVTNKFGVGVRRKTVVILRWGQQLSADDAMNLAAYLVAMAEAIAGETPDDLSGARDFDAWLNAIRAT